MIDAPPLLTRCRELGAGFCPAPEVSSRSGLQLPCRRSCRNSYDSISPMCWCCSLVPPSPTAVDCISRVTVPLNTDGGLGAKRNRDSALLSVPREVSHPSRSPYGSLGFKPQTRRKAVP